MLAHESETPALLLVFCGDAKLGATLRARARTAAAARIEFFTIVPFMFQRGNLACAYARQASHRLPGCLAVGGLCAGRNARRPGWHSAGGCCRSGLQADNLLRRHTLN